MEITVEAAELRHAEEMLALLEGEHLRNFKYFEDGPTLERQRAFLKKAQENPAVYLFVIRNEGRMVGTVGLHEHDPVLRTARLGIMLFSPEDRGHGIGTMAIQIILAYGFVRLCLNKVYLNAFATNLRSIALYVKIGFVTEGRLREEYLLGGKYIDLVRMSMLKREWEARS